MVYGLAAVFAGVDDHPITFREAFGTGDFGGGAEQVAEQSFVASPGIGERADMLAREDKHMGRRLRIDVREGVAELVLVEGFGGNASFDDLAEDAAHDGFSVQEARTGTARESWWR